jgi:CheY-like chemotaxis protein
MDEREIRVRGGLDGEEGATIPSRKAEVPALILVAEDDDAVLNLIRKILKEKGYLVLRAANGEDALRLSEKIRVDLVVSDLVMPGMNGRELVERLQARNPRIRAIYMSGHTDEVLEQLGVKVAAHEMIRKPFTPEELVEKVREALGR